MHWAKDCPERACLIAEAATDSATKGKKGKKRASSPSPDENVSKRKKPSSVIVPTEPVRPTKMGKDARGKKHSSPSHESGAASRATPTKRSKMAAAGTYQPDSKFGDGFHTFLYLTALTNGQQIAPTPKISIAELAPALRDAKIPIQKAIDNGQSAEWILTDPSEETAQQAVETTLTIRGKPVKIAPYYTQGPRLFLTTHVGSVDDARLATAIHTERTNAQFTLFEENVHGILGEERFLLFNESCSFRNLSSRFPDLNFTVIFRVVHLNEPYEVTADHFNVFHGDPLGMSR